MKYKNIVIGLSVAVYASACSPEFENGTVDIDSWVTSEMPEISINHPCLMHTAADFKYVKEKVDARMQPWLMGYQTLEESPRAKSNYRATPIETTERPGSGQNQTNWDGSAAYQLALMWKFTGEKEYADAAIGVLNDWAYTNKAMKGNERILTAGFCGYVYANAAEIMRDYEGWRPEDLEQCKKWLSTVVAPICHEWLTNHFGGKAEEQWLSWDLPAMVTLLSIGILNDDVESIQFVYDYFFNGAGPGNIENAVICMHADPDGNVLGEHLAQSQEVGRDSGHMTLNVPLYGYLCQMFYNIGIDLFSYQDNLILDICEYVAKYNVYPNEAVNMPFTPYYKPGKQGWMTVISQNDNGKDRGRARPGWELIYNHYKVRGANPYYSRQFAREMRPEGDGHRNSAESGDLGFGTLMFTREPIEPGEDEYHLPRREY